MKKLSDQLADLSTRAAKVEDVVAAAQDRDRERLEAQRSELQAGLGSAKRDVDAAASSTATAVSSWWDQTRAAANDWFDGRRVKNAERRDEWNREKAELRADDAEADAADAIDFALYELAQAEYAIIDATLARADADALTTTT